MKTEKSQLFLLYLLLDLFILSSIVSVQISLRLNTRIQLLNEYIPFLFLAHSSWIIVSLALSKKFYFLQDGFLYRINKINETFLLYFVVFFIMAIIFLPKYYYQFLIENTLIFYFAKLIASIIIDQYLKYKREVDFNVQRAVIITKCKTTQFVKKIIKCNPILGYKFIGFLEMNNSKKEEDIIGCVCDLDKIITEYQIHVIFSIQNISNYSLNASLSSICDKFGVRLRLISMNEEPNSSLLEARYSEGFDIINIHEIPLDDRLAKLFKRLFDFLFSACVTLFLLSWLIPVVSLIIKLSSNGPVFFTQKRTGINNRTFTCYKFRTMVINDHSDTLQALPNDSRITAFGRFMRETNIDELPQFFNVLLGQMSIVGPRPHMLEHTKYYSNLIENYLIRHYIKPGITGWAQVNGYHGETKELWKMERRVEYDLEYLNNWNFLLDIKIILQTVYKHKVITSTAVNAALPNPMIAAKQTAIHSSAYIHRNRHVIHRKIEKSEKVVS